MSLIAGLTVTPRACHAVVVEAEAGRYRVKEWFEGSSEPALLDVLEIAGHTPATLTLVGDAAGLLVSFAYIRVRGWPIETATGTRQNPPMVEARRLVGRLRGEGRLAWDPETIPLDGGARAAAWECLGLALWWAERQDKEAAGYRYPAHEGTGTIDVVIARAGPTTIALPRDYNPALATITVDGTCPVDVKATVDVGQWVDVTDRVLAADAAAHGGGQEIMAGLRRVEEDKPAIPDPNGDCPTCMNAIVTWNCERCGRDVRTATGACPAVPPEQRWRMAPHGAASSTRTGGEGKTVYLRNLPPGLTVNGKPAIEGQAIGAGDVLAIGPIGPPTATYPADNLTPAQIDAALQDFAGGEQTIAPACGHPACAGFGTCKRDYSGEG